MANYLIYIGNGSGLIDTGIPIVQTAAAGNIVRNLSIAAGSDLDTNLGVTPGNLCAGVNGCFCNTGL